MTRAAGDPGAEMAFEQEPDLHAARRERRRRREREAMRVHGRGVRRLAELSARPGHLPPAALGPSRPARPKGPAKRRRAKRRRR